MGLAKLPEEAGYHYLFVNLSESYDEKLLTRFYKDLMIPNFPIQDGAVIVRALCDCILILSLSLFLCRT